MKALCYKKSDTGRRDYANIDPATGLAGTGSWRNDQPDCWIGLHDSWRPYSECDRVIDSESIESLKAEIDEFGSCHLYPFLRRWGLAHEVESVKFNNCNYLTNCVDYQFDHPGSLAIGVRTTYECPSLCLRWTSECG